jgi:hypothetical protein
MAQNEQKQLLITIYTHSVHGLMDELFFWPSILCALNARSMDAWLRLLLLTILFRIEAIRLCFMIRIIGSPFASPVMMPKQPQKMVVLAIGDVQVGGGSNLWHPEHLTALMVALTRLGNWRGGSIFYGPLSPAGTTDSLSFG